MPISSRIKQAGENKFQQIMNRGRQRDETILAHCGSMFGLTISGPVARAQVEFNFAYTGKPDNFTVPIAGTYRILAFGAQGGNGTPPISAGSGGLGAEIGGDFDLTDGEALTIAVGGAGSSGTPSALEAVAAAASWSAPTIRHSSLPAAAVVASPPHR